MKKSTKSTTANKTKSAKTTKKSITKKASLNSELGAKARLKATPLRVVNLLVAIGLAIQAAALVLIADRTKGDEPVTANYLVKDPIASDAAGQTVMASASDHLLTVNLLYVLIAALLSAAIFNLLLATRYRQAYDKAVLSGANQLRFTNYMFALSAFAIALALIAGVRDIASLLIIVLLVVTACSLGAKAEAARISRQAGTKRLAIVMAALPAALVGLYTLMAHVYGGGLPFERLIPLAVAAVLLLASSLVLNNAYRGNRTQDYVRVEKAYGLMLLLLLSGFSWAVLSTLLR